MAKKKAAKQPVLADANEAIQVIDARPPEPIQVEKSESEDPNRKVKIILPVQLKINRVNYGPGTVIVPMHVAESMIEMVDKKRRADISVFTGNNYLVERMIDRSLVVTKVDKI